MKNALLIYPHQLFEESLQSSIKSIFLVEEPLFFKQFAFHKKKLIFHRASMKAFAHRLEKKEFEVIYVEFHEKLIPLLQKHEIKQVQVYDLADDWVEKGLKKECLKASIKVIERTSPCFYLTKDDVQELFDSKNFNMAPFYIKQRKRFNILVDDGKPIGGKWSFDTENRKKLPKNLIIPSDPLENKSPYINEAKKYVEKHFSHNYGSIDQFFYPITHGEALKWLQQFLEQRLDQFGPFEDSISSDHSMLFHSLLSPLLNVGLLTPKKVIDATLEFAKFHQVPLNSLEGFIRQILGWREYIRGVYVTVGGQERTRNFFNHTRPLPESFWNGTTGILPVDNVIHKVLKTGYAHHIERLMVMANFMLLCQIKPDDVYRWFMELFIDAYDWVMVPNVYGMGQYADGGMMSTKPYISGSNYLLKMSDFPKSDWAELWNSLYWNFIDNHLYFFEKNPRCGPIVSVLKKMDPSTLKTHKKNAESYLHNFQLK